MSDVSFRRALVRWQPHTERDAAPAGALAYVAFAPAPELSSCPLVWLGGDFYAESWQIEGATTTGSALGWAYTRHARLAFAATHIDDGERLDHPEAIQRAARDAYRRLFALQAELGLAHTQRIWHWLSAATAGAGDDQRYQRFCRGRAQALDAAPAHTMPPATLVAGARRGLRMHALLGEAPVVAVENPRQVSAYRYPRSYGLRAPAFARAGVCALADSRYLLISGTASIVGHATRHAGEIDAQAREALANLDAVIAAAGNATGQCHRLTDIECLKAYLRRPADTSTVEALLRERLPGVPLALLHAPLCRAALLVEFEAQIRL